jgi:hypothetical protein
MSRNHCLLRYGRVRVWVGILGDQPLGLAVLPNTLTCAVYRQFSVNELPVPLEHVSLHQQQLWFMQDGAPPHFLPIVRQHVNQTFGEQWIGLGGPVNRPTRSSDHDPLDVWLWGHLKMLMYSALISNLVVLQQRVENACQEIRVKPGIFDRVRTSVRRRAESCVEMHKNHIRHLL